MPHNPFSSSHAESTPAEPPPAYSATPATSGTPHAAPQDASGHLAVPGSSGAPALGGRRRSDSAASLTSDDEGENGLSAEERVSMEDSFRELPEGWRREFDPNSQHFFFVDTKATPPRSIWVHPLDDPQYLKEHPEHREASRLYEPPSEAPPSSSEKGHMSHGGAAAAVPSNSHHSSSSSGHSSSSSSKKDDRTLGRKLKDKMTGSTHEERVAQRKKQKEEELKAYQQYVMRRKQIMEAQASGRYQPVYAAPSMPYGSRSSMYGNYGGYGGGMYGRPGYGGYGYGGGMYGRRPGMMGPGMAMGGGLLGGLLLGDMLF